MTRAFSAGALAARRTTINSMARLCMVAALVGAAACSGSDSSTGPSNKNPVGEYPLVQVDKKAIPFVIYRETGYTVTVTDGELDLEDDGTFFITVNFTDDIEGEKSPWGLTDGGTYQIEGNTITLASQRSGTGTGTMRDGNVITLQLQFDNAGPMRQYAFRLAK
jgi:hypothetical protein